MAGGDEGWGEYASDMLVKFLMSRNVPVHDVLDNSHFRTLLESVAQHGQQSCLLLENPTVIQRSLWRFEHEIKKHVELVIASWETTGCTMMPYNLRGEGNKVVLGFYCPKGFIFTEEVGVGFSKDEVGNVLKNLTSDSTLMAWRNMIQYVRHDSCCHSACQFQAIVPNDAVYAVPNSHMDRPGKCIRQQVLVLWRSICKESKWVRSLIKKSDQIYEAVVSMDLDENMYNTLKQKGDAQVAGWTPTVSFSRLGMVMKVESELRAWLSRCPESDRFCLDVRSDFTSIINNHEFWSDGNELLQVLTPLFRIPELLDTLVPSAGYLGVAIAETTDLLKTYSVSKFWKFNDIWKCFDGWVTADGKYNDSIQDVSDYLSPAYILRQVVLDSLDLAKYESRLYSLAEEDPEYDSRVLDPEI